MNLQYTFVYLCDTIIQKTTNNAANNERPLKIGTAIILIVSALLNEGKEVEFSFGGNKSDKEEEELEFCKRSSIGYVVMWLVLFD